jgi:hypothetical protein
MCTVFVPWCKDGHWSLYVADCNFGDMSAITVYHADSGIDGGFRHLIGAAVTTIAKAISKCAQESVGEIMQLVEVVDINGSAPRLYCTSRSMCVALTSVHPTSGLHPVHPGCTSGYGDGTPGMV